jgi:type I restriction enzyme S subunit
MELMEKQGYKQTDLGYIPIDWEVISLGDSLLFKNGLNKASEFFGYGTPIINYMDVFNNYGIQNKDIVGKVFLNSQEKNNFSARKGDVFFTRTSETQEAIGTSAVLLEDIKDCVFSGFVLRGRPFNTKVFPEYFQYCLIPNYVRTQIIATSSYTTRALTNGRFLSKVKIIIPKNLQEQKAIATALSDVDELITNLDKLILKKKAIKQGAMQQLLKPPHKGGKRLVGFSGNWEESELGNYANLQGGYAFLSSKFLNNGIPIIRISNIQTNNIDFSEAVYTNDSTLPNQFKVKLGDVLIAMSGATTGKIGVYKSSELAFINQRVGKFCPIVDRANLGYIRHLTQSKKFEIELTKQIAQGAQPNISGNQIESFSLWFPKDIKEQKAIAEILSNMDLEIEQLESKKAKYQSIKQGMMQELLTGKTRLI